MLVHPSDQTHLLLDNRYSDGIDYQAKVLLCQQQQSRQSLVDSMRHPAGVQHQLAYNLVLNNIGFHSYHVDDCIYHELGRSPTRKVAPENRLVLSRLPAACAAGERATIYVSMSFLVTQQMASASFTSGRTRNRIDAWSQ